MIFKEGIRFMVGKPKYNYGDIVKFTIDDEIKTGSVEIIDAYGTFFQTEEPSYDVKVKDENCLYKHIRESFIEE
jgi:hypothetical protein